VRQDPLADDAAAEGNCLQRFFDLAIDEEDEEGGQELELTEAQAAQMAQIARSLGLPGFGRMPVTVQGAHRSARPRG
jgi:hypothetical protein